MARKTPEEKLREQELGMKYHEESLKHWRSWGSWFSWGSPVGLGLFFISLGITFWVVMHAINL